MNDLSIKVDLFAAIIFLGVIQGLFLSFFFLGRKVRRKPSNLYLGFLMLVLSLVIFEIFLNHTGYMYRFLRFDNFSEPLSFAAAPLMYCYIYSAVNGKSPARAWLHMLPMLFWLAYSVWYFIQPLEIKQLHYLNYHYPEMGVELPDVVYRDDPLKLRRIVNELIMVQLTTYLLASILFIRRTFRSLGLSFLSRGERPISWLRNFIFLMFALLATLIAVKTIFQADVGDHLIASLIALVIYITSFNVIRASDFFRENVPDQIETKRKYKKSGLQEQEKEAILNQIKRIMEEEGNFKNPLVSLPLISKKLGTPVHHISQVINEKLGQSFFEMIANYRIEEAKRLLKDPAKARLTVEDVADEVGYNSKSAFNRSFKSRTGLTPSAFRDNS
jgi:AraC-like DNA-binding protein